MARQSLPPFIVASLLAGCGSGSGGDGDEVTGGAKLIAGAFEADDAIALTFSKPLEFTGEVDPDQFRVSLTTIHPTQTEYSDPGDVAATEDCYEQCDYGNCGELCQPVPGNWSVLAVTPGADPEDIVLELRYGLLDYHAQAISIAQNDGLEAAFTVHFDPGPYIKLEPTDGTPMVPAAPDWVTWDSEDPMIVDGRLPAWVDEVFIPLP